MKNQLLICSAVIMLATPALATPWVRGYVVDGYEPAFHYGGEPGGTEAPGADCPKGAIADNDYRVLLKTSWRSDAQVADLTRSPGPGQDPFESIAPALYNRGFRKDIDTYINPFAAPDPGIMQVTGKIAEGFNLDGDSRTGFTAPDGEKGIDNGLYRAWGCLMSFRGPAYHAVLSRRANDRMLHGLYTMVIRISGSKDPRNDDGVTVELAYSPDPVVKDAGGRTLRDYSYRAVQSGQYTRLKGKIRDGVLVTAQTDLRVPEFAWAETNRGEALFRKGRLRLVIAADGSASGLLGGYRDWRELYGKDTFNVPSEGPTRETIYHENQIAMYYALKRNADGMPDPRTGQYSAISTAYRFTAVPAWVVDPAAPAPVNEPLPSQRSRIQRILFLRATMTKAISPGVVRGREGETEVELRQPQSRAPAAAGRWP